MILEEMHTVDAPGDAAYWGGVAAGALITVGIGWLVFC
ncbi:hypothetical protein GC56T3_0358 [Geobacillus sp. C56-T3]|nr:hypothetical protein GC56T3_0358 [Geobacillus sp. C56-T3]